MRIHSTVVLDVARHPCQKILINTMLAENNRIGPTRVGCAPFRIHQSVGLVHVYEH